ncbi:hypothetical protein M406DRAFT_72712 [Cryphonectria parasitica EP155]|uniref:Uncharacterized protein n=1 Tax=Cryphonectria parasitica (strain ATCC 38755 / EP155) TaxID=660469 RepID=A0A9P4XWS4_CRYP1|nr:uncharacterized protein M406DRAFT_72712 [Cryphonectria parasitica EP155]KAF3762729.1 hypothetical protein M406DRAFT_72712 [Cryphonectria parasitica EP155]
MSPRYVDHSPQAGTLGDSGHLDGNMDTEDKEDNVSDLRQSPYRRQPFYAIVLFAVSLVIIGGILLVGFYSTANKGTETLELRIDEECGESAAQARQAGCVFDAILMGWVPWRCHDTELAVEFMERNDWAFYHDMNKTGAPVPEDEILQGEWRKHSVLRWVGRYWMDIWQILITQAIVR